MTNDELVNGYFYSSFVTRHSIRDAIARVGSPQRARLVMEPKGHTTKVAKRATAVRPA